MAREAGGWRPQERTEVVSVCGSSSVRVSAVMDGKGTDCLVDTGATVSILPIKFFTTVRLQPEHKQTNVRTVNGQKLKIFGSTKVEVALGDHRCGRHKFLLADVKTLSILGVDFFEALQMTIDFSKKVIQWDRGQVDIRTPRRNKALSLEIQNGTNNSDGHVTVALAEMEQNTGETFRKALARAADLESQLDQEKRERAQERRIFEKEKREWTKSPLLPKPNSQSRRTRTEEENLKSKKTASQSLLGKAPAVQLKNCVNMQEESTSHSKALHRLGNKFSRHKYGVRNRSREFHHTRNYDAMKRQRVNHHCGDQVSLNEQSSG